MMPGEGVESPSFAPHNRFISSADFLEFHQKGGGDCESHPDGLSTDGYNESAGKCRRSGLGQKQEAGNLLERLLV